MSISVQHVYKGFGSGQPVLEDVSLQIRDGEFLCLLGPSGCGKSTLLNMIAGLDTPTQGTILVGGSPVTGPGPDRCYLFQESALFPWLDVLDNVRYGMKIAGLPKGDQLERARRYLEMVGLWDYRGYRVHQLSGGMKQRVALARALAVESPVLLMDEPFAALDSHTKGEMRLHLLDIWAETERTVIFVTHSIQEAFQLADRVALFSAHPARIAHEFSLPRPRNLASGSITSMMTQVRDHLSQEVKRVAS